MEAVVVFASMGVVVAAVVLLANLAYRSHTTGRLQKKASTVIELEQVNNANKAARPPKPRTKWTELDDETLRSAVAENGPQNWKSIAEKVPGRTHVQCLQRWKKVLRPGLKRGKWCSDEDAHLCSLVDASLSRKAQDWASIAVQVEGRSAKQCRERWCSYLDPELKKGDWTPKEDRFIVEQQGIVGNHWAEIARQLPGRTENSVKSRALSIQRAKQRAWKPEEDALIMLGRDREVGRMDWAALAGLMPSRTKHAIKRRYREIECATAAAATVLMEGDLQLGTFGSEGRRSRSASTSDASTSDASSVSEPEEPEGGSLAPIPEDNFAAVGPLGLTLPQIDIPDDELLAMQDDFLNSSGGELVMPDDVDPAEVFCCAVPIADASNYNDGGYVFDDDALALV